MIAPDELVIGVRFRAWRERHSITQVEVARLLCVGERTVARWEHEQGEPSIAQVAVVEAQWPGFLAVFSPGLARRLKARRHPAEVAR